MTNLPSMKSVLLCGVAAATLLYGSEASAQQRKFDIPSEEAVKAIPEFARQAGVQIVAPADELRGVRTPELRGDLDLHAALTTLLAGTGIQIASDNGQTIILSAEKKSAMNPSSAGSSQQVEEIVVTAQKRGAENLQSVPIPVTALSADALADNGEVRLRDYYATVPGLSVSPSIQGAEFISIRGVTTGGFSNPTIAILVDDVPFGAPTGSLSSTDTPDFDPGDLARVEVLRGPQGTLYGANSMGGLIKYVTKDPSMTNYSGRIEIGTSGVYNGDSPGYTFRGSGNIPVSDTFALRASAFTNRDPGYIDDVVLDANGVPERTRTGVNELTTSGGRLAALWQPSDSFSIKLSGLYQYAKSNGTSEAEILPGLKELQQAYVPGTGGYERVSQAYSATITTKFWGIELTSVTGYNINHTYVTNDYSFALGKCCTLPNFGVTGTEFVNHFNLDQFTQEIRFSGQFGPEVDWLLGGFYAYDNTPGRSTRADALNPETGQAVGTALTTGPDGNPLSFQEYAFFGDLTYHVTDDLDIQIGGRQSHDREVDSATTEIGPFVPLFYGVHQLTTVLPASQATGNAFTYLVTPRYKVSPDLMIYARLASGYRPGGANALDRVLAGAPTVYSPDKTKNYEIGVKGDFLDHRLSIDASLYYIDWTKIQIQLLTPLGNSYNANGSAAKSQGVEFGVKSIPIDGLTISAWVAYDDAVLTQALPANSAALGASGDRLANTPRFSGYISLQDTFSLTEDLTGFVGGEVTYAGDRVGQFQATRQREVFPSYVKTDLRAGIIYDTWTANIYLNNVTDERGVLNAGGADLFNPAAVLYIQPRTVGITLSKTF